MKRQQSQVVELAKGLFGSTTTNGKGGRMKLRQVFFWAILALAISGCTVASVTEVPKETPTEAPKVWEYKSETVTYSRECLAEAIKPFRGDQTIMLAVEIARGDSALAFSNVQQLICFDDSVSPATLQQIANTYATCADRLEDTYLNEMGSQGWEMVSFSRLEETTPDSQWCRGVTVDYGYEVAWKRVR